MTLRMKKIWIFLFGCFICIGVADAAVRDDLAVNRTTSSDPGLPRSTTSQTVSRSVSTPVVSSRDATSRGTAVSNASRVTSVRDTATPSKSTARSATAQTVSRSAVAPARATTTGRAATSPRTSKNINTTARAATSVTTTGSTTNAFGGGYNTCRDAYFTCMDQFCGKQNDTYRRCICSSRLDEIKNKERALTQTQQQLQDFKDLNIEVINKSSNEVKAMLTASEGESAIKDDKSSSGSALAGISSVLNKTKSESLSTQGKLDIAGDINAIWSTTDLAAGADLANLTGESLYNAVHSQCIAFAAESCDSQSTVNMVVSAYGMYIENDCSALSSALDKKTTQASGTIRATEREMNQARLENYDAHNSTSINDCIAQVRKDITTDTACGTNYVHCLDITGQYLNKVTGEPIYSPEFYQLDGLTSLSGDVLTNQANRLLINELNRKKEFAKKSLDTCRDLSDDVWEEFMRQAITEIYQGQQARIRQVKNECIDVVNECFDTQSKSLKDFSNVKEQLLLGSRLELSEQMCKEKLDACSNLYGGGSNGLDELLATMKTITDQKIAKECKTTLEEYVQEICAVPSADIVHSYPFACRTYAPGEQQYATRSACNVVFTASESSKNDQDQDIDGIYGLYNHYSCGTLQAKFTSCKPGYYMAFNGSVDLEPKAGNRCLLCPKDNKCLGGLNAPTTLDGEPASCGADYIGSLYQKVVRYAMQTCVRPSESSEVLPATILGDVNMVMDTVKVAMVKELSKECERLGGLWFDAPFTELKKRNPAYEQHEGYMTETSANPKWGSCLKASSVQNYNL